MHKEQDLYNLSKEYKAKHIFLGKLSGFSVQLSVIYLLGFFLLFFFFNYCAKESKTDNFHYHFTIFMVCAPHNI